jgi:hypothetical protein
VVATLMAWLDQVRRPRRVSPGRARLVGGLVAVVAVAGGCAGVLAVTHGHPVGFIKRQWNGFSHEQSSSTGSHFTDVGSGRYDFWRVALDAFVANPIGGLGQDNFDNYYVLHRRTGEEPAWPHSLELRLLAMTGVVGFVLFGTFLIAAVGVALRSARRRPGLAGGVAAIALLPVIVWLIHGSLDWFWEMPALSGPALGFLGLAVALGREPALASAPGKVAHRAVRGRTAAASAAAVVVCTVVLGFPYLSARETAVAQSTAATDPNTALSDLNTAADLDPLSAAPGRVAGSIALDVHSYASAQTWFAQVVARDPGGWFGWFGEGLAASALGDSRRAHELLARARSINSRQPIIGRALSRVYSKHPVSPSQGLSGIISAD